MTVTEVARVAPKWMVDPAVKPVPVTVTEAPPASVPVGGVTRGDARNRVIGEHVGRRGGRGAPAGGDGDVHWLDDCAGDVAVREVALVDDL